VTVTSDSSSPAATIYHAFNGAPTTLSPLVLEPSSNERAAMKTAAKLSLVSKGDFVNSSRGRK